MTAFKSEFLHTLNERGFIHQCSDPQGLDKLFSTETVTAYTGYDCTAPSVHVGNLVSMMMLHWLQKTGHRPIALMGGGTTMVGDPSGRDETRQLLTAEKIQSNKESIREIFANLLDFGDGPNDAVQADNADWLLDLKYIDFLRDVGSKFSVNQMLARDSVKLRLEREQPLSFIEFNYMILQAYDYTRLNKEYGCRLQMGGSDQWGNIVSGIDLCRRMNNTETFALTTPLITKSDGSKMGKSVDGAVWLRADMYSPYDYWQFWRNTGDADVIRFLKLYTTLPMDEVNRLAALEGNELNEAKKILATEATALIHGRAAADEAAETARKTFEAGQAAAANLPTIEINRSDLEAGMGILNAFVAAGLAKSNGEARRNIKGGALKLNDKAITDDSLSLTMDAMNDDGVIKLSMGKKKHILLKLAD
ncbi:tyrosine--tRNA ligase [Cohaesibacter gelatinilyticus]|uniref:Tyrosine--tRNA ligase n=1 Tax=Cohaesibacter gelatinilyticus TaxID=372072 RepID=A0A285NEW9_9HYPH|nr:tyrosine--tRNA ligase [Cohaesibacter gelatinilyticus]SNZ08000.1 tyrosyl-tRNA synthetase [Cohaesibacter gelatinilyticus]